ncbi:MAG: histidine kinase [Cyclobacteriaceae bacterium]|nr:histidine kinase [Cyclobacteriaceae bacterium]
MMKSICAVSAELIFQPPRMYFYLFVNLFFFLFSICSNAQEIVSFNINQKNGLPSNTIYSIFQDTDGFLWIGTENGLARYNGSQFRMYENSSVRSKAVTGIFQDSDGRIWLHNFFGEILYVEGDSLRKLTAWEGKYSSGFPTVSPGKGFIAINSSERFFNYTPSSAQWVVTDSANWASDKSYLIHHLIASDGNVWLCSVRNDVVWVCNENTKQCYTFPQSKYHFDANRLRLEEWQKQLLLWDASQKRIFKLAEGGILEWTNTVAQTITTTRAIKNVGDSVLAFIKTDGVDLMRPDGSFTHLLQGKNASTVATDHEGNVWVGTLNDGLFYIPSLHSTLYSSENFQMQTKLISFRDQIIAGSQHGKITILNGEGSMIQSFQLPSSAEIQSLFVDEKRNRLLAFSDQLYVYDLKKNKLERIIESVSIKKIIQANDLYVLATSSGIITIDPISFQPNRFLTSLRTTSVVFDSAQQFLWIGTQKGVYTTSLKVENVKLWNPESNTMDSPGVSASVVANDFILLGTFTNGLFFLQNGKVFKHLTIKEGLPSNKITALTISDNAVWIGTDRGMASYLFKTQKLSKIDQTKGLISNEVYALEMIQGQVWVAGREGVQRFLQLLNKNEQQPMLHIQSIKSDTVLFGQYQNGITLPPHFRQLIFNFDVSNNLRSAGTTTIYYRIKELENERWNKTTLVSPVVNYVSLPFGDYTFEAFAENEDGTRSSNVIAFAMQIQAPFWRQTWFLILVFFGSRLMLAMIAYLRLRKAAEQREQQLMLMTREQDLRIAQLTSIRAQMNPHFIFNTMSLIQSKVLVGLKDEASHHIQNFSTLLRKVLDFSAKETILLQEEIEILEKYLAIEKDRFDGSLNYTIDISDAIKEEMIRIPSLLTQPFVENALRHGLMHKAGTKVLHISISVVNEFLRIHISDNGIGRKAAMEFAKSRKSTHQSFAMAAYQKRIDLLNFGKERKIELEIIDRMNDHQMPEGTSVIIHVPIDYES